ncbi:molybdopterin-dependent oxidoreductase [Amaricoccus sp. W119]|uniref:molybdopterin-dependent oxidoreductase n=1 Tax=Amaricoccus sp. W119 TaxID=3391833 RepID=UPI0039A7592B
MRAAPIRTTCPYCGVGCGVLATPDGAGGVAITGDAEHPANFGRLCSKGSALGQTVGLEGRLLTPRIGGEAAGWDAALNLVAARIRSAIETRGPESVAIYGSGQMLTEDYYVANKLMKGFIGAANIDTNSRLCMASSVAGHRRAFGTDTVPGTYEDLEEADLVVLVGSNLAWCHPVLYQRLAAAKAARPGMKVVTVDPRRTATTDLADLHLALRADTDVALFNALLAEIARRGAADAAYLDAHVTGLDVALESASATDPAMTGLAPEDLARFLDLWIGTKRVVTVYSQGVNQSQAGTDKVNAIINCHLATGRIGRPGMGPFSVTGQPNAMGGREVGGLANMLAAHLDIENPTHRFLVGQFWNATRLATKPGLKAVDLFRACGRGEIEVLWVIGTNPVVSMPEADAVAEALGKVPLVVVSDMFPTTDTARRADVLLPALGWGEKSGTVTNSERRVSRQRAFLPAPGEARPDWWALAEVGRRLGHAEAFAYESPAEIFREYAALSALAAAEGRDFDISALIDADYDTMAPAQWPVGGEARFFAEGGFFTPDRKGRMIAVTQATPETRAPRFPLTLNTGRVRDQWHTMTRTGRAPRLGQHVSEPFAEIHPADAGLRGIGPADLVELTSPHGRAIVRALVTDRVQPGDIFVPMHWSGEFAARARVDALVPARVDPHSGQPASKMGRVEIRRLDAAWYGFAVSRSRPEPATDYWAIAPTAFGWRAELAGLAAPEDWAAETRRIFGTPDAKIVSFEDRARGTARIALVEKGRVVAALFVAPEPVEVARAHVVEAFETEDPPRLLAGRPGAAQEDKGAIVCVCYGVGVNTITGAIARGEVVCVETIGAALKAGSNCGSCRPELKSLLATHAPRVAAE